MGGMDDRYDVIVLGLGGMGSAAAWHLAERGARTLGVEQFGAGHDRGSSHGGTRIVRRAYFEHSDYVPLLSRAYELWDALAERTGRPTLVRTGALMIGAPDSPVVRGTLASAERWNLPHRVLDTADMARRYPQFALRGGECGVYEADAGYVGPEATVRAHLDLAAAAGADLRFGVRAGWGLAENGVEVDLGDRRVRADRLVLSAGAWTSALLAGRTWPQPPLRVVRRVMHFLAPPQGEAAFAPDRFCVYVFQTGAADEIYGFPFLGPAGAGVKVGFHHRGGDADPDHHERSVTDAEKDEMHALLAQRIPGLAGPTVDARACMYTMTPDEHFVIGRWPGTDDRVSVAAGFSGHGFKFVPVVGEILADLALDGVTSRPIGFLSPERSALVAGRS